MKKKAIATMVSTVFLLLIIVIAGFALINWFSEFRNNYQVKMESSNSGEIELMELRLVNNTDLILYLRNFGKGYNTIDRINLNNTDCDILSDKVVNGISPIFLNCSYDLQKSNQIDIFANSGVFSKKMVINQK